MQESKYLGHLCCFPSTSATAGSEGQRSQDPKQVLQYETRACHVAANPLHMTMHSPL